ncbi:MAG: hypothetical protein ACK57Y_13320, partial [Pirellulaceae bacterium]
RKTKIAPRIKNLPIPRHVLLTTTPGMENNFWVGSCALIFGFLEKNFSKAENEFLFVLFFALDWCAKVHFLA